MACGGKKRKEEEKDTSSYVKMFKVSLRKEGRLRKEFCAFFFSYANYVITFRHNSQCDVMRNDFCVRNLLRTL